LSKKLGFIGGGVMAEALLSRLLAQKIYQPQEIIVSDPQAARRVFLVNTYGIEATDDNRVAVQATEAVVLAVKPQVFAAVVNDLAEQAALALRDSLPLIVSILAGVDLGKLEAAFRGYPVVRAMPNTPATVGAGMTAIALGSCTESIHLQRAQTLFQAVGEVVEVPESLMDAVTGLSGSGPAYIAIAIEALADGGVAAGLPRPIAAKLALQTVLGTAQLLHETKMHPAELKDRVTSPGGTTIAGISQLEQSGFRSALIQAVKKACDRSKELGS
jgi:pyrroline-5-carboxylate reductase